MPQEAITFSRFGGLLLDRPIDEVGPEDAIELLDVDWRGSTGDIAPRSGAVKVGTEGAQEYEGLFWHNTEYVLTRRNRKVLVARTSAEEKKTVELANSAARLSFAHFGTPSAEYTYIANEAFPSTSPHTIRRFDGTEFTSPKATVDGEAEKAMPEGHFIATWPDGGNRLVVAGTETGGGPAEKTSGRSHVWFSEPGNAESYESTAFVQLSPGDGEEIMACCVWNGMVFVFKETQLFVFYGVSTDAEGKPVFNYRTVSLGTRIRPAYPATETYMQPACPGREGVYFLAPEGIYITSGGTPVLVSGRVEAMRHKEDWMPDTSNVLGSLTFPVEALYFEGEKLYAPRSGDGRMLVYNTTLDEWTAWTVADDLTFALAAHPEGDLYFVSGKMLCRYDATKTTDASVTMEPLWRSGFYDLDIEGEKTLSTMKLWGSRTVSVKVARNLGSLGSATSFATGAEEPFIKAVQKNKTQTGTTFSHRIEGAAPWRVKRIERWLREGREPTTKTR